MTISDPISDMLTRMRNAVMAGHSTVSIPKAKMKVAILDILKTEGFIENYEEGALENKVQETLRIQLKYVGERRKRRPVISGLRRVSRPGRRVYVGKSEIPWVQAGMGVAILSTPKGVMTGANARKKGIGGELLCEVW
jgi:small subunit ribosomal protein S8